MANPELFRIKGEAHPICDNAVGCFGTNYENLCSSSSVPAIRRCGNTADEMGVLDAERLDGKRFQILICPECFAFHYEKTCDACRDAAFREQEAERREEMRDLDRAASDACGIREEER